jgi:hypothetical protein
LANLVSVTGQGGVGQVIGDDEEDVWFFRRSERKKTDHKEKKKGERFHMTSYDVQFVKKSTSR